MFWCFHNMRVLTVTRRALTLQIKLPEQRSKSRKGERVLNEVGGSRPSPWWPGEGGDHQTGSGISDGRTGTLVAEAHEAARKTFNGALRKGPQCTSASAQGLDE